MKMKYLWENLKKKKIEKGNQEWETYLIDLRKKTKSWKAIPRQGNQDGMWLHGKRTQDTTTNYSIKLKLLLDKEWEFLYWKISPSPEVFWDQTYKQGIQNSKIKGPQSGETLRPEGQNPQKSRIWNVTPHGKPHKWIAHFLHVFTKYQWMNTAQGVTDR